MNRKLWSSLFAALILTIVLCGVSSAQDINGSLVGTVRDSSGAVVPGATVTVSDQAKDIVIRTVTTNDDGSYSVPNIPVAVYTVTVEAANFKKSVNTDVKVDVGQRRSADVTLEAGNISESVTVTADAVAVDTNSATSGTTINGDQIRELSINNRNFVQLVTLAPGVTSNLADQAYVGSTNPEGQANIISLSVNGSRSSQNTFTVDGADITDRGSNLTLQAFPSVDSIQEFKVLRSLFPAESGSSGGGQINVVTRSGTDKFHGSAFEFVRNEKFNAGNYFTNQTHPLGVDSNGKARRTPFRYNDYGFTIGGPVYFFNFGEKDPSEGMFRRWDKNYFFFSEERRSDIRYITLNSQVPDASLRNGIFPIDICLSATRTGTTRTCNNVLAAGTPFNPAMINPVSLAYLNVYRQLPLPNSGAYGLLFPDRSVSKFQQEIFKYDTTITDKLSGYYRYERDQVPTIEPNSFSSGSGMPDVSTTHTNAPGRTHTIQATYALSPTMILEGRYVYSYGAILVNAVGLITTDRTSVPVNLTYPNQRNRIPTLTGNGFNGFTGFGPYDNFSDKHNWGGSLTWIVGNHTTKFGANFSKYRKNENALAGNNEGAFSGFLNTTLASPTADSVCAPTQQNTTTTACINNLAINLQAYANFLLGTNASFTQAKSDYTADVRQRNFEAYAQDEFRFRPNLTLYFGVRYSFFGSPWDRHGLQSNFVPELYDPSIAPLVNGNGDRVVNPGKNFCNGLIVNTQNYITAPNNCTPIASPFGKFVVNSPKKNFAPRVGLAWDPWGNGKTSIRTGYGIYHEQTLVGIFEQNLISNPPFQETTTLSRIALDQPFGTNPVAGLAAISVRGEDTDWKTPYMQHWSLDVQQQLSSKTVIDIGYYGSKGTNLIGVVDINLIPPGDAAQRLCATGTSVVPTVACQTPNVPFTAASLRLDQIRPYRGYRAISMIKPMFNSNYHSLQIAAQHRFSGASQVNLAYTWSKNLTDAQTDRSSSPQNPYNIKAERGRAQLDRRHVLTVNWIYELPFYETQKGFVGKVLGGWQTSSIVTYQTGLPFTATISGWDPSGLGLLGPSPSAGRPDQIGDPNDNAPHTQLEWFDTSAFQTSLPGTYPMVPGSAGRGSIFGPRTFRVDFTLSKNIRFNESMNLQLRGEAFNVLNTTNFSGINTTASSTLFGQVNAVRDPRTIQLGIKFLF
jgi:hypothetical protein